MSNQSAHPFQEFSRRLEAAFSSLEREISHEIRRGVDYVDRIIVPEVRHETSAAARTLAGHLERLATRLERQPLRADYQTAAPDPGVAGSSWHSSSPAQP